MGRRPLRIHEIRDPHDPRLPAAHRLLGRTFLPEEVVPRSQWREVLSESAAGVWTDFAWHLLIATRDEQVLGVASGSYLGSVNVAMVGYLAVHPKARGLGLGPRLRHRLKTCFERDALRIRHHPLDAILGEVRPDNPWLRHLVARAKVLALDFPYVQPPLGKGRKNVELVLYYESLGRKRRSLRTDEVRRLLYAIWRRLYRIPQPLKSSQFRELLRSLHGRRRIGGRPLSSLPPPQRSHT